MGKMPLYVAPIQNVYQGIYQADWNATDNTSASYVNNKPTALSAFTNDLAQPDWTMADTNDRTYIQNKPTALSQFTNDLTSASICTQLAAATLTGTLTTRTGTATAAPLVVPTGALLTTPVAGSVESDADGIYHTQVANAVAFRTHIDACQYQRRSTNSGPITGSSGTTFFPSSPNFIVGSFYEIEMFVVFTNTGAYAPYFGYFTSAGTPSVFYGEVVVTPSNAASAASVVTTFNSSATKAIGGGNAAGTFFLRFRGVMLAANAIGTPVIGAATGGTITVLANSYWRVYNRS
jgi:hypothetical protein